MGTMQMIDEEGENFKGFMLQEADVPFAWVNGRKSDPVSIWVEGYLFKKLVTIAWERQLDLDIVKKGTWGQQRIFDQFSANDNITILPRRTQAQDIANFEIAQQKKKQKDWLLAEQVQ